MEMIQTLTHEDTQTIQNIRDTCDILVNMLAELNSKLARLNTQMDEIKTEQKEITYADLFCGLGAFHTAFNRCSNARVKYKCVYACDIDENARNLYQENYGIQPTSDINEIDIDELPNFDILCAGFPCQPFSIAGNKKGFSDEQKGNLFNRILQIIDIKKPSTVFLENVKNLHTIHNGKTFKTIYKQLTKRGYNVSYKVIDSKYYNSPQSRKRIYIICSKSHKYEFQSVENDMTPVSTIIDKTETNFLDYDEKYKLEKCTGNSTMVYKLINKITDKGGRQGERVYDINKYGPTICASSGGPGAKTGLYLIGKKIRTLNIKETLQMFGFNVNYKYTSIHPAKKILFHLGNSIVVNVLEYLISDLHTIL
jgi:DNA (cytosine-5)-methyltransferase 1